jgi:hypothetical protein
LIVTVLWFVVFYSVRGAFAGILQARVVSSGSVPADTIAAGR